MKNQKITTVFSVLIFIAISVSAQTGGNFTITQSTIAGGGQNSTGGAFSLDGTIGQPIAGNELIGTPFAVTSGFWNFSPADPNAQLYEGDVAPRPNGDRLIQSDDVVQVQRFQIGLDQPDQSNEFQRADSAPLAGGGDGAIQSNDVVQTQRYQIGLDAPQPANGPSMSPAAPAIAKADAETSKIETPNQTAAARALSVESPAASVSGGQAVIINLRVDAVGDESAYGFTLNYNQLVLTSPTVAIGTAGGSRFCNTTVAGQIKCSINNFPDNNPASNTDQIGEIAALNGQLLVKITFTVAANAPGGATNLTLSGVNASNDLAQNLAPITATGGTVTILGPTAAAVTISGRILTQTGSGILNVQLTLTNTTNGEVLTARSGVGGVYQFDNLIVGQDYILSINAKHYKFNPNALLINLSGELTGVDFAGKNEARFK